MTKLTWLRMALVAFAALPFSAFSDDAVGVFRVDVFSNETVSAAIPFHPLPTNGFDSVVSGGFSNTGDGISYCNSYSGEIYDLVFDGSGWVGADDGLPPPPAGPGDSFLLFPGVASPFSFYVFGKVPFEPFIDIPLFPGLNHITLGYPAAPPGTVESWKAPYTVLSPQDDEDVVVRNRPYPAPAAGCPAIVDMDVDPSDGTVGFEMVSAGGGVDVFERTSDEGYSAAGWSHAARFPAFDGSSAYFDDGRLGDPDGPRSLFYLVSDSGRDTDEDGLSDALEIYVYGTSPFLADTDGDGRADIVEIAAGSDPLRVDGAAGGIFAEGFEQPAVSPGEISGQNGWRSSAPGTASVKALSAYSGLAGLAARAFAGRPPPETARDVSVAGDTVWIDLRQTVSWDCERIGLPPDSLVAFGFDDGGHPYALDGSRAATNRVFAFKDGAWARCTAKIDFEAGRWDLFIDARRVFEGLALGSSATGIDSICFRGYWGDIDDITVSRECPGGLSFDGDAMDDEWELATFGNLSRDGVGDADGDGISDADEYAGGTDPLVPDAVPAPSGPDPAALLPGLTAEFRRFGGTAFDMPDFDACEPFAASVSPVVDHPASPWPVDGEPGDFFVCRLSGYLLVPADAVYNFYLTCDDGAELRIDGETVVSDTFPHSWRVSSGVKTLEAGYHEIEIMYYDDSGVELLRLEWYAVGRTPREVVPAAALFHRPENFPPVVTLAADEPLYYEGGDIELFAQASDLDGCILSLTLYDGALNELGSSASGALALAVPGVAAGTNRFYAVAADDGGCCVTSVLETVVRKLPKGYVQKVDETISQGGFSVSGRVARVSHPLAGEAWEGSPFEDSYSAVYEGYLFVSDSGAYVIALASDDGSRLYIDGEIVIDGYYAHQYETFSAKTALRSAMHEFRVEYFENAGQAGIDLMWDCDGTMRTIPPQHLFRSSGESDDSDGDGMPDWWEEKNGLDPEDPSDAASDPDGDGIANFAEFLAGTDPQRGDSDGDGMPDGWEASHGTQPFVPDALDDPDGDGLPNIDEFQAGTDPLDSDTDGDGYSDVIEFGELGTDATIADAAISGEAVASALLTNGIPVHVATSGIYAVAATVTQEWNDYGAVKSPMPAFDRILFGVDGHEYAWRDIPVDPGSPSTVVFYTPVLGEGTHFMSVGCGNPDYRLSTSVANLAVSRCAGLDLAGIAKRRNHLREPAVASLVSPAFIEGDARFPWRVSSDAGTVRRSGTGTWYLDIPLNPAVPVSAEICFEDAATTNVVVEWEATDPFGRSEPVLMRSGSRLLFSGCPGDSTNGTVRVETNGVFACAYAGGSCATLEFPAGRHTVVAEWEGDDGAIERSSGFGVEAVGGRFPRGRPACLAGQFRTWNCPQLPDSCIVESDCRTFAGRPAPGVLGLTVTDTRGERMVAARICENGPVLDVREIDSFWAVAAFGNAVYSIETNEYGRLSRSFLSQRGAPAGVAFRIQSFLSSVLLDDLEISRTVGPDSFDVFGHLSYDLISTDAVTAPCHSVYLYQGAEYVGEAVYGNGPLPEEWR